MNRNEKIIYVMTSLFLIILLIFGVSYAYYTAQLSGDEKNTTITITSDNGLSLNFNDGTDQIIADDIAPGWGATKTFSVKNPGIKVGIYSIVFKDLVNTFINTDDLVYTLTSNAGLNIVSLPLPTANTNTIATNIMIGPTITQNYTLTIKYLNSSANQIDDVGATFAFKIYITGK